jgi:hypothetical protein
VWRKSATSAAARECQSIAGVRTFIRSRLIHDAAERYWHRAMNNDLLFLLAEAAKLNFDPRLQTPERFVDFDPQLVVETRDNCGKLANG